ncbi:MAG TPA: hypothetical protein H9754_01490 [Candidatus Anaerostipes avistercoris]|uniref:tRNA nuclease CdiA C-terminal domain-containing protein n=1 Tax=Candidatus Anaerostipes avistercoris TaxID=2838462 RepID=A0A9D2PFF7_9FIRM|nr:hypothetical protein [Candidatus Anaerostipes avistercoris]
MKKLIALLMASILFLTACNSGIKNEESNENNTKIMEDEISIDIEPETFADLSDENLLQYIEDEVYAGITEQLASEDYTVESVDAIYISKEYLEEIEYNSQENIYFGYTLSELDAQYNGTRYVFTLGDDGQTTTKTFEKYDDTYEQVIKNIAIGTGVILVCATVSVASVGVGAPAAVSMVFAASAKTGATFALSSGIISTAGAAIVTGIETKNVEETLKTATLAGSESFKWGAIVGVVTGGVSETVSLAKSARSNPTPRESELKVLERTKGAKEQISYLDGVEVSSRTKGATRPDVVVKNADGSVKAIEVKNYNLASSKSRSGLYKELKRQVASRVNNLPSGSTQEIVLDIRGRGFSKNVIDDVVANIQSRCAPVYKNIPVTVMSY